MKKFFDGLMQVLINDDIIVLAQRVAKDYADKL